MMQTISANILRLLDESGTTSTELAKNLGITRQTLANYLKGNTVIDTLKLLQISDFFNVSVNDLLGCEQNRKPVLLFRTALNYTEAIDQCSEKITSYIERYSQLAKATGRNISFSPEQYNLQIEVDNNIIDINYELDDYTSKYKLTEKLDSELEYIANEQRRLLGLEDLGAISLISAITTRGINVVFLDFGGPDMFGLSVCDNLYGSFIFINDSNAITAERKLFTLAHEYGHLLLHRPLYSKRIEQYMPKNNKNSILDSMADCFAGYLLCPYAIIKKNFDTLSALKSLSDLIPIKLSLQISLSSLMTNLHKYNFVNKSTLTSYFTFLKQEKIEKKEISSFIENNTLKGLFQSEKQKQQIILLKSAYKRNLITNSDVEFFLNVSGIVASDIMSSWSVEINTIAAHDFQF